MKELEFLEIIAKTLSSSKYLGDDCAYLEAAKIFVTQDTLVEDIHFSLQTTSAYELGQKAIVVNISDLCTTLGTPKWATISLSLPKKTSKDFIEEFYKGVNKACNEYGVEVVGGDITGSNKIVISVCAIAQREINTKTGRNLAKTGDTVAIAGISGASALGLYELSNSITNESIFTDTHLIPKAQLKAANNLKTLMPKRAATMDTSDGLADALFKIAKASKVKIEIDENTIPTAEKFDETCKEYGLDSKNLILYGGEDFALLATMDSEVYEKLDKTLWTKIGTVTNKFEGGLVAVKFCNTIFKIDEKMLNEKTFDHFKGK